MSKARERAKGVQVVARNRKALFEYEVLEEYEAGLVLAGTEVKSLRDAKVQLLDAYATIDGGEAWLHHLHISEYSMAFTGNHEPTRKRKLLLRRSEIAKLHPKVREKGLTLVPLEVHFRDGLAKLKLGLCRGKAAHDKRATIKKKDEKRDRDRSLAGD